MKENIVTPGEGLESISILTNNSNEEFTHPYLFPKFIKLYKFVKYNYFISI